LKNLSLSVPDLLKTVKQFVQPDKHGQLDQMLNRYLSKELGKQQLQLELRSVAGRDALRQALLAMVPQIDELQKKRELMKRSGPPPQRPTPMGMPQQLRPGTVFLAMSAPPRRRSRRLASASTAAPSPDTPPPARLLDLPTELLVRALSRCDPADIARVAAVSLLFQTQRRRPTCPTTRSQPTRRRPSSFSP